MEPFSKQNYLEEEVITAAASLDHEKQQQQKVDCSDDAVSSSEDPFPWRYLCW